MTAVYWIAAIVVLAIVVGAAWQHFRYLKTRREVVQDRQSPFYPGPTFHVITLLKLRPDEELLADVGDFKKTVESAGAELVYAGKAILTALPSSQIPEPGWDAIVLTQYEDRGAYARISKNPAYQKTLAEFETHYSLGMDRPAFTNLALHQLLLGVRISDLMRGTPPRYPFTSASPAFDAAGNDPSQEIDPTSGSLAEVLAQIQQMTQEQEFGRDAVLVFNFIEEGTTKQRAANAAYGREMLGLMAEQGCGPMHLGQPVVLEGDANFDSVVLVYYPGVAFMAQMVTSDFYTGIAGGKQLHDTHSTVTVPLLSHL